MASNIPAFSTATLDQAARRVPPATANAATRLLQSVAKNQDQAAFITAVLNALVKVTSTGGSGFANHQQSEYGALLGFLSEPEALAALRRIDPLAPARLRGLRLQEDLLAAEGGAISTREIAAAIGITRQAIDKRRKSGALIGVSLGKRGYLYPAWQVGLNGLTDVLAELRGYDPWTLLAFMLTPNIRLEGRTPLTALRAGDIAQAVEAAQLYGEQVAA